MYNIEFIRSINTIAAAINKIKNINMNKYSQTVVQSTINKEKQMKMKSRSVNGQ